MSHIWHSGSGCWPWRQWPEIWPLEFVSSSNPWSPPKNLRVHQSVKPYLVDAQCYVRADYPQSPVKFHLCSGCRKRWTMNKEWGSTPTLPPLARQQKTPVEAQVPVREQCYRRAFPIPNSPVVVYIRELRNIIFHWSDMQMQTSTKKDNLLFLTSELVHKYECIYSKIYDIYIYIISHT